MIPLVIVRTTIFMTNSLAIDIGSTTTVVTFQSTSDPQPEVLKIPPFTSNRLQTIPSILWVDSEYDEGPKIGRQVLEAGLDISQDPRLHRDFKRWIGTSSERTNSYVSRRNILSPEQAGELLLLKIWTHLPNNILPDRLILTAPVDGKNRYKNYRSWLLAATASLDVNEIALVDEPTAAAIGAQLSPGSIVLVIDLGGSTIDIALVKLQGGEGRATPLPNLLHFGGRELNKNTQELSCAEVISKAGLPLGGRDIDFWIASKIAPMVEVAKQPALLKSAERLKCQLSINQSATDTWIPNGALTRTDLTLDRYTLDNVLHERGLLLALDGLLERVLATGKQHGLKASQIDAILPVGGTTRIPTIQRWLQERCGYWPLLDEHPIEAVARGALSLVPKVKLKDSLTRGVSLRCWNQRSRNHNWYPLFIAGQSWPTSSDLTIKLACGENDQKEIALEFGEPDMDQQVEIIFRDEVPELQSTFKSNSSVKSWVTTPLRIYLNPPGKLSEDRLQLSFRINERGQIIMIGQDLITHRSIGPIILGFIR
uniref:Putative DnaK-type molecular chaperone n=1 Tax=Paulinella micropora TaxID=1928728 RepID=A0A385HZV3_9EUKA|nr:putative DnaK-type molecular chaperone [Paulinella micropora]AXY63168.1 putative DnaK-type molecular chaperone [Paulinella micropora]